MKKVLVKGPIFSRSGYGEQARFALRSLAQYPERFDIFIENIRWGNTGWIIEDDEERRWLDSLAKKSIIYGDQANNYDISIQVTIPQEWQKLALVNIGYTAGTETTKISREWMQASNYMDKIIVPSEHSKFAFVNTVYDAYNEAIQQSVSVACQTPVEIVNFPVKEFTPEEIDIDLKYDFNFLVVSQWSPRKNLKNTIRWFMEEFKDDEVGLVLKINCASDCTIDKAMTLQRIQKFANENKGSKCKLYVLHGTMKESEMTGLYTHPKIKALINISHGEGFGLPVFEAACHTLPVIASCWGGITDFMKAPEKQKKSTKVKNRPHFATVEYDIKPIQPEAVWEPILVKDSMWCFPKKGSYKKTIRNVYKDYGQYLNKAKKIAPRLKEILSEKNQFKLFADHIYDGEDLKNVEYVFVSDMFANEFQGGAELSLQTLIDSCPSTAASVKATAVNEHLLDTWKESKWIFANMTSMNPEAITWLKEKNIAYSFIEYDYKMCKHRNPALYEFVEGEACEYAKTGLANLIKEFMTNAQSVFFMAKKQRDIYCENFPELKDTNTHILSSLFEDRILDYIQKIRNKSYEKEKWLVLSSSSWVKGVAASEKWCKDNNVEYEVVGGLRYDEFLKKLRKAKGVCFKPDGLDTCPRFIIEAKLLDCELELNEKVQHTGEEWFNLDNESMIKYLKSRKDYFWQKAF
jgi:glycosyltransferase involved in cell wall biosynthesis